MAYQKNGILRIVSGLGFLGDSEAMSSGIGFGNLPRVGLLACGRSGRRVRSLSVWRAESQILEHVYQLGLPVV